MGDKFYAVIGAEAAPFSLRELKEALELQVILWALKRSKTLSAAARMIGIHRKTLLRTLIAYGLPHLASERHLIIQTLENHVKLYESH